MRRGLLQGVGGLAGQRLVGLLLEPFGPVGRFGREQLFQVDGGRRTVGLLGLDGDRTALGPPPG